MKQRSKKDRFYIEVGEAMASNDTRNFINLETLEVEIHPPEEFFSEGEMDSAFEATKNPDKFLALEQIYPSQSFEVMQAFTETLKNKSLQQRLFQALERKKPFANFKNVIDDSPLRENWFDFKAEAYAEIAKEWLEENASEELKQKIKSLPSVFIAD